MTIRPGFFSGQNDLLSIDSVLDMSQIWRFRTIAADLFIEKLKKQGI